MKLTSFVATKSATPRKTPGDDHEPDHDRRWPGPPDDDPATVLAEARASFPEGSRSAGASDAWPCAPRGRAAARPTPGPRSSRRRPSAVDHRRRRSSSELVDSSSALEIVPRRARSDVGSSSSSGSGSVELRPAQRQLRLGQLDVGRRVAIGSGSSSPSAELDSGAAADRLRAGARAAPWRVYGCEPRTARVSSARLAVSGVAPAPAAVLAQLEPLRVVPLALVASGSSGACTLHKRESQRSGRLRGPSSRFPSGLSGLGGRPRAPKRTPPGAETECSVSSRPADPAGHELEPSSRQLDRDDLKSSQRSPRSTRTAAPADRFAGHQPLDIVDPLDRLAVELDDQVLGPQPGALGRAVRRHLDDLDAAVAVPLARARAAAAGGGRRRSRCRPGARDPSRISAPMICRVASLIGTASPRPTPATAVLIPTTRAAAVDQRAARVARIQRGVGLDHVVDEADGASRPSGQRAAERRHDAGGHGAGEPVRVADRDDQLADAQPLGLAERRPASSSIAVDAQHREVGQPVDPDDLEAQLAPVDERAPGRLRPRAG